MKQRNLIVAASAIALTVVGFFASAAKHRAVQFSAFFQTTATSAWQTVFTAATTSNLNTTASSQPASFNTGVSTHRMYATKSTSHPLYYK